MEHLCLNGFHGNNVRGIIDLCEDVVGHLLVGAGFHDAMENALVESLGMGALIESPPALPTSLNALAADETVPDSLCPSEQREFICRKYELCAGNISATQRALEREHGLRLDRKTLTKYLCQWGLRRQQDNRK
jgi:hypothetical protein